MKGKNRDVAVSFPKAQWSANVWELQDWLYFCLKVFEVQYVQEL